MRCIPCPGWCKFLFMYGPLMVTWLPLRIDNLRVFLIAGLAGGVAVGAAIRWLAHYSGGDPKYQHFGKSGVSPMVRTEEYYATAWRDRRRRMAVFKTVQISFFPLVFVLWFLSSIYPQWGKLIVLFPVWLVAYMIAGIWLNRFKCPRCGKLYYWRVQLKGSFERGMRWRDCHHCGLRQDQYS